ncbi:MAG TPA: M20/M25/M40 family metallo-hydrolase [Thermoanaerobaculia bacterium]|nr:M20/M25/M40 family metallo-hydrolase [Thermoanaerobaculia bacterium]
MTFETSRPIPRETSRRALWRFFAGVAATAVASGAALVRLRPPAPRPATSPARDFSAARARRVLEELAGDGIPHPEGSAEAASVRGRIVAEFRRLGDVAEIQSGFACGGNGVCGSVANVVARRPGEAGRKAVLLSAHFDSVGAGPGASDDGMGVAAILEVARALRAAPLRRPVVFLIDDGEEQGLLGAQAFAAAGGGRGILADVNLEARGTTGPSFLFETSGANRWLARLFSRLSRPTTSSLFSSIYRAMPNDTDLTVFRAHGIAGVNFACVNGVARYHTPKDDVAHADPATLQHQGDNALEIARALDRAPDEPEPGDAVWFDLFGATVVGWPAPATLPAAAAVAVLAAAGIVRQNRKRRTSAGRLALGFAAFPAAILGGIAGAALVSAALRRMGALPAGWIAHPGPAASAIWLGAFLASGTAWGFFGRRAGPSALRSGIAAAWAAASLAAAGLLPGASFPLLVPAAIAAILLAASPTGAGETLLDAAGGFFLLPLAAMLLEVLGFRGAGAIGALLGLVSTLFAARWEELPPRARHRVAALLGAGLALSAAASFLPAPFSPDAPQRATIVALRDADSDASRWIVETDADRLPPPIAAAAPFQRKSPYPWAPGVTGFAAPAPSLAAAPPELRVESDTALSGARRITGRLASPRGATIVRIAFPPAARLRSIAIGGTPVPPLSPAALRRGAGWKSYACVTVPAEGIPVEIVAAPGPLSFVLADRTAVLPPSAGFLASRRGATAVPSQSGDGTIVMKRVTL